MDLQTARGQAKAAGTASRKKFDTALWWLVMGVASVVLIAIPVIKFSNYVLSSSERQVAGTTAPAVVTLGNGKQALVTNEKVIVVRDPNTNENCPGPSEIETLTEAGKTFNPHGCPFYAKGTGTVIFTGMFIGEIEKDISKPYDLHAHVVTHARSKHGTLKWKYTRCEGSKKDMGKDGCA